MRQSSSRRTHVAWACHLGGAAVLFWASQSCSVDRREAGFASRGDGYGNPSTKNSSCVRAARRYGHADVTNATDWMIPIHKFREERPRRPATPTWIATATPSKMFRARGARLRHAARASWRLQRALHLEVRGLVRKGSVRYCGSDRRRDQRFTVHLGCGTSHRGCQADHADGKQDISNLS